jgi:hypothetical protein
MVVHKKWKSQTKGGLQSNYFEGWFLLGFLPIYIRQTNDVR